MIKLIYLNQYRQILHSDGRFFNRLEDEKYEESYPDIASATEAAELFVKKHPLYACQLVRPDNTEEIVITADGASYDKAHRAWQLEITDSVSKNTSVFDALSKAISKVVCQLLYRIGGNKPR